MCLVFIEGTRDDSGRPQNLAVERNEWEEEQEEENPGNNDQQNEELEDNADFLSSDPSQLLSSSNSGSSSSKNTVPPLTDNSNTSQSKSGNQTLLQHSRNAGQSRNYGQPEDEQKYQKVVASDRITPTINDDKNNDYEVVEDEEEEQNSQAAKATIPTMERGTHNTNTKF